MRDVNETSGKAALLPLALICILAMINYMDRMVLPAVLPLIKAEFALSDTSLGLLSAVFAVVYALSGIPLGRLADCASRRKILSCTAAFWSVMTAASGFSVSFLALAITRVGLAFGQAGYLPAAYSLVADLFVPAKRVFVMGLLAASTSLGVILGFALGGWLGSAYGWRMAFIILAIPGVAFAWVAWIVIKDPVRGRLDREAAMEASTMTARAAFASLFHNRLFVWLTISAAFNSFCIMGMVQWLPSFFERVHHLPLTSIGALFGITFGLGMTLGQIAGGMAGTILSRRRMFGSLWVPIVANILTVIGFLLLLWTPTVPLAMVMTLVSTLAAAFAAPIYTAAIHNSVNARIRATAHGLLMLFVTVVAMAIGPLAVGIVSDRLATTFGGGYALRLALTIAQAFFVIAAFAAWRAFLAGAARDACTDQPDRRRC